MNNSGQINIKIEKELTMTNDGIGVLSTPGFCQKCLQTLYTELGVRMHHEFHNLAASMVTFEKVCAMINSIDQLEPFQ